jgi:16S rRNA (guanine527-N7)-methyltransferase
VVTRSSVPYPWSVEMVSPVVKENGIFIPFLGRKTYDLNLEKEILAKTAFNETKEIDLIELEFLGKRHIKFLQKAKQKREFHPRPWAEIQKEIRTYNG